MDIEKQLAVQSFCFRNFKDNREVAGMVKECGLSAIELCGVHADFNDESSFDDIIGIYRDSGVSIISIGVEKMTDDKDAARRRFEFVKKAGAQVMSVDFPPDSVPAAYRTVEELADEYDILCGIHNHGGRHWLGSTQILAHVFNSTSKRIGLSLDTAWALDSGEDPVAMADRFSERIHIVHLKDFTFSPSRQHKDVIAGTGNLDLSALFTTLEGTSYDGPLVIEYEADPEAPVESLKKCADNIRRT